MKLTCDYEALVSMLTSVSTVVEDAMSSEELKNIIFRVVKDTGVELIGINRMITYRCQMGIGDYSIVADDAEYSDTGVYYMQIKSKELLGYLGSFRSLRRTKVKDVILEVIKNKVQLTTVEEDLETGVELSSRWAFDNIPIKPNLLSAINLKMPEEGTYTEDTTSILLYTSCLLPIMQNGTNLYSKIVFGEDKVVAFNAAFTTLMNNVLGDVFKGICLSYRAISFMRNVLCDTPSVVVAKTAQHLCFKTENSEAFICYDNRIADYSLYAKLFTKDHAVVLDRPYFKDVLKRLSLINDAVEFHIPADAKSITVKNSKFSQEIPVYNSKGISELGGVSFKVLPEVLNKAIIGDDAQFSNSIFMYLAPTANGGYSLIFSDDGGFWFSVASIR